MFVTKKKFNDLAEQFKNLYQRADRFLPDPLDPLGEINLGLAAEAYRKSIERRLTKVENALIEIRCEHPLESVVFKEDHFPNLGAFYIKSCDCCKKKLFGTKSYTKFKEEKAAHYKQLFEINQQQADDAPTDSPKPSSPETP